jgi:ABC-type Zn2+ transport system substrate-binding protein/surface adhesin
MISLTWVKATIFVLRLVKNRFVQDDRRASNQQDEDRRKDQGRRAPSHDLADNRSDTSHEHQHNRDHQRQHQHHLPLSAFRQNSDSMVKDNAGKKDSNKPRKILTQDSLIMNVSFENNYVIFSLSQIETLQAVNYNLSRIDLTVSNQDTCLLTILSSSSNSSLRMYREKELRYSYFYASPRSACAVTSICNC